jgi:hypothetical protein
MNLEKFRTWRGLCVRTKFEGVRDPNDPTEISKDDEKSKTLKLSMVEMLTGNPVQPT